MRENGFGWVKGAGPPAQEAAGEAHRDGRDRHKQHRNAGDTITRPHPAPEVAPEVAPEAAPEVAPEAASDVAAASLAAFGVLDAYWPRIALRFRWGPERVRVIQGVVRDDTAEKISGAINRTKRTVETHIERTRTELRVRSRAAITRIVLLEVIAMMQEDHARQMGRPPEVGTEVGPQGEKQDAGDT